MLAPPPAPQPDVLEALIREARERQLRRRLLGAAAVAIAAAIGLSAYGLVVGGSAPQTGLARAGTPPPLCRASQLTASFGWQGATQSMLGGVTVENTGETACSLPLARPKLTLYWNGRPLQVQERKWPYKLNFTPAHVLLRGNSAVVETQWWNWCGRPLQAAVPPTVLLRFADGLRITARAVSQWGVPYCNRIDGAGTGSFIYVSRLSKSS